MQCLLSYFNGRIIRHTIQINQDNWQRAMVQSTI